MPGPTKELATLLTSMFSASELRRFLLYTFDRGVVNSLPENTSLAGLAKEVVVVLQSRGLDDARLWDALEVERPRRADDIRRVKAAYGDGTTPGSGASTGSTGQIRLLFMSADVQDRTLVDREARNIRGLVDRARNRDRLNVELQVDLSVIDLPPLLRNVKPAIVHFSGHSESGHLIMRGPGDGLHEMQPDAIDRLFQDRDGLRMVVLNGSYTKVLADLLGQHVDYVVGCASSVSIGAAAMFSPTFYQGLADGETVERSFRDATDVVSAVHGVDGYAYVLGGCGDPSQTLT